MFDQADAPLRLQQHATLGDSLLALSPTAPLPEPPGKTIYILDSRVSVLIARVDLLQRRLEALEQARLRVRVQRMWETLVARLEALWRSLWGS